MSWIVENDVYCQNVDDDDDDDDGDDDEDDDEDDKLAFCLDDCPLNELSTLQCLKELATLQCLKELATFLQQYTVVYISL